jgi:hypothetical protein
MHDAAGADLHDASAQHVTALTSLVGSAGLTHRQDLDRIRSQVRFKFADEEGSGLDLVGFLNRRLAYLSNEKARASVFADLIKPALKEAGWGVAQRARACDGIATMTWDDLRSASLEIVGAARHDEIVGWCRAARTGTIALGSGERAIAALGQNVLDVHNQDELEVVDSLSQASVSDEDVLLIHPKLAVLYSRKSRSFTEMCDAIGGCPYVLLTNVVLAYNEYLLDRSARLIDDTKREIRDPRWVSGTSKASTMSEALAARAELFENQTLNALPNIFRYPGERDMFDQIEAQRGLKQRAVGFERFTVNYLALRQGYIDLIERVGTRRTNRLLMALGILQVSGLFLAALSLDEFKSGFFADTSRAALWSVFCISFVAGAMVGVTALWRR